MGGNSERTENEEEEFVLKKKMKGSNLVLLLCRSLTDGKLPWEELPMIPRLLRTERHSQNPSDKSDNCPSINGYTGYLEINLVQLSSLNSVAIMTDLRCQWKIDGSNKRYIVHTGSESSSIWTLTATELNSWTVIESQPTVKNRFSSISVRAPRPFLGLLNFVVEGCSSVCGLLYAGKDGKTGLVLAQLEEQEAVLYSRMAVVVVLSNGAP
ncbi:hypothetical protein HAX54_036930 [Datura stramonium]|uniref:Uncharacterized protein n=1 Tax=Datura stramonium TaxID=4076 RepID=A0ABS8VIC7_DATST|nr:hypothetical protein [Datura stramonium]